MVKVKTIQDASLHFMSLILQMFEGETIMIGWKLLLEFFISFFRWFGERCYNFKSVFTYLSEIKLVLVASKSPSLRNAVM